MQIGPRFLPPTFISGGIPRINWSHPITDGLLGVFMPQIVQANLVTGEMLIPQGTFTYALSSPFGAAAYTNSNITTNTTGFKVSDGPLIVKANSGVNWSIFAFAISGSASASDGIPAYGERGTSGNDIIKLDFSPHNLRTAEITIRNDAGTLLQIGDSNAFNDNLSHTWLATKLGNGGGGNVILYRDGASVATGNWTGTDSYTDATLSGAVLWEPQNTLSAVLTLMISAAWSRVLSPIEAELLANDPFCMLIFPEDDLAATLVGIILPPPPFTLMPQIVT